MIKIFGIIGILTFAYLLTVGLTWILQWLVNATFNTAFDFNVWLLAIIIIIISSFFKK